MCACVSVGHGLVLHYKGHSSWSGAALQGHTHTLIHLMMIQ